MLRHYDLYPVSVPLEDCYPDVWCDPDVFISDKGLQEHAENARDALVDATWILWSLTYKRFSSKALTRRDLYRMRPGVPVVRLAHGPVGAIVDVQTLSLDGDYGVISWQDRRGGQLGLPGNRPPSPRGLGMCGCVETEAGMLQVEYHTKPNLPRGAERATKRLAYQMYLDSTGAPCALPDRITSVQRQGVSWTLLDPMDFLDRNLTGIGPVDQWITAVNGKGVADLRDPLMHLELVESDVIGCGPEETP